MSSTVGSLVLALLIGFLIAAATGCKQSKKEESSMAQDIETISRELGLKLPSTARVIGVHRERGMDDAVLVKLEVSVADWQTLRAAEPLKGADFAPANRGYLPADDGWWDPSKSANLPAAQIEMPRGRVLNIGADEDAKPGAVVVFAMNHGT